MSDNIPSNRTQMLFLELNGFNVAEAFYTLGDADLVRGDKLIPSIKNLYVAMADVHEHKFATKYFANWKHWQRLLNSPLIRPHIDSWREELEAKIRSENIERMEALAAQGDRMAIKYMANVEWKEQATPKRGRPSKDEITGERKAQAKEAGKIADDYDRIMGQAH